MRKVCSTFWILIAILLILCVTSTAFAQQKPTQAKDLQYIETVDLRELVDSIKGLTTNVSELTKNQKELTDNRHYNELSVNFSESLLDLYQSIFRRLTHDQFPYIKRQT